MKAQRKNNIIANGILITTAIATACCTAGFLNTLDRDKIAFRVFIISLVVLATIYITTKKVKPVKNIIESTEPHKTIKWACGIMITISIIVLIDFIFTGGILILISGFM